MDLGYVFSQVASLYSFLFYQCSFTIYGISFTVGDFVIYGLFLTIVISFVNALRG